MAGEDVYCTLLTNDSYLAGAAVLAQSLKDSGTTKKLAVLVAKDSVHPSTIDELKNLYDFVIPVDRIASPNTENLYRLGRLDLRYAFTKIALWRQTQFRKIVYIDADVVALRAPDELFKLDASFAAAPDIGWPDCFNSGVMVLSPNMGDFWSLQTLAASGASFDGADQGLLNEHYMNRPWHRLSFTYNCTPSASYQYEPAYRHFRSGISMVHFIGVDKPWKQGRGPMTGSGSAVYKELLGKWWSVYDRHYKTSRSSAYGQLATSSQGVQQWVKDEQASAAASWASEGVAPHQPAVEGADLAPAQATEQPMTEPGEEVENIQQGFTEPTSTVEQRRFSAPSMEWDATRSEPPSTSKPEASSFPSEHYEMSNDRGLFQAPKAYPEPPKDMWYEVPETKPTVSEKPKPIFPWEQAGATRIATRVFSEEYPTEPQPIYIAETTAEPPKREDPKPATRVFPPDSTPTIKITSSDPWDSFTRGNAWDANTSIDQYVRALKGAQSKRKVQVLHQSGSTTPTGRPEALTLTDLPSGSERMSFPVTPAPMRRPTFWGTERDDAGDLPAAQGVPEQADWNPSEKLEQLRRSSINTAAEPEPLTSGSPEIPIREMPSSAGPLPVSSPTETPRRPVVTQVATQAVPTPARGRSGTGPPPRIAITPPKETTYSRSSARRDDSEEGPDEYSIA